MPKRAAVRSLPSANPSPTPVAPTKRSRAKASRRTALLAEAARLFAERGFNGVSIEDLGAAVGVSGPALYRHFSGKQAVLQSLLVGVSEDLLSGGQRVITATDSDDEALRALIGFHVDFALRNPDVIHVQDRDLDSLGTEHRHEVRVLQRRYVELWVEVLARIHPDAAAHELRIRAHATFGLMNSTPYSVGTFTDESASASPPVRSILEQMAWAALEQPPTAA